MSCLYQIIFPDGKSYIGITHKTAKERFKQHYALAISKKKNYAVYRALRQHDHSVFDVRTLVIANDWDYLCKLEVRAIKSFNTQIPHGYNLTIGGEGVAGNICTEATRAKMIAAHKNRPFNQERYNKLVAALGRGRETILKNRADRRINGLAPWEFRIKQSTLKSQMSPEEYKKYISDTLKSAQQRPEVREKIVALSTSRSERLIKEWADPIMREKKLAWRKEKKKF